jgi:hypothetical protein
MRPCDWLSAEALFHPETTTQKHKVDRSVLPTRPGPWRHGVNTTRPLGESNTVIRLRTSLENLRSFLVDLEALAHAAWETLDKLPFLPTSLSPRSEGQELESRLNYGRLQALVTTTASSAKEVLLVCSEMVESSYELPATNDDDDEGGGSGGTGTAGSSHNGEPDGSGPGNGPQAQAITDAEPDVNEPQARQEQVEVSFDDIDDGPSEPPGCPGSRVYGRHANAHWLAKPSEPPGCPGSRVPHAVDVPRALRSRAGIMLDTATMPPVLTPLVLADAAHIVPQPTAPA